MANDIRWEPVALEAQFVHSPIVASPDRLLTCQCPLQKFAAVHASIHNHFNQVRHLNRRDIFKQNRSTALAEWRQLAA
jgi:hypothetical protein